MLTSAEVASQRTALALWAQFFLLQLTFHTCNLIGIMISVPMGNSLNEIVRTGQFLTGSLNAVPCSWKSGSGTMEAL